MWYTSQDLAKIVGVHVSTIYNWEKRGIIVPAKKTLTDRRFYSEEQIKAYLEGRYDDEVLKGVKKL